MAAVAKSAYHKFAPGLTREQRTKQLKILGTEHIAEVEPYAQGAAFHIIQDSSGDNGYLDIIYLPDGQYAFTRDGEWTAASPDENGTLRWVSGNTWVAVTRLTDHFFLEESNAAG